MVRVWREALAGFVLRWLEGGFRMGLRLVRGFVAGRSKGTPQVFENRIGSGDS